MALVLDYAAGRDDRPTGWLPPAAVSILLIYAHLNLCWQLSRLMLIPICNHLDHHFNAWTPVAWLPGCATTLWAGSAWGSVMMFLSSVLAGRLLHLVLDKYCFNPLTVRPRTALILRDWHVWLTAVLWLAWVPVPSMLAFICQFEIWATTR